MSGFTVNPIAIQVRYLSAGCTPKLIMHDQCPIDEGKLRCKQKIINSTKNTQTMQVTHSCIVRLCSVPSFIYVHSSDSIHFEYYGRPRIYMCNRRFWWRECVCLTSRCVVFFNCLIKLMESLTKYTQSSQFSPLLFVITNVLEC